MYHKKTVFYIRHMKKKSFIQQNLITIFRKMNEVPITADAQYGYSLAWRSHFYLTYIIILFYLSYILNYWFT